MMKSLPWYVNSISHGYYHNNALKDILKLQRLQIVWQVYLT